MARYILTTEPPTGFDDLVAGQTALMLLSGANGALKLVDQEEDHEWGVLNGTVREVVGTGAHWDRLDRPGEREFVQKWQTSHRWGLLRNILGHWPSQAEMDTASEVIQWLGTPVGMAFFHDAFRQFEANSRTSQAPEHACSMCNQL